MRAAKLKTQTSVLQTTLLYRYHINALAYGVLHTQPHPPPRCGLKKRGLLSLVFCIFVSA